MSNRHLIGDLSFAILLVLPLIAFGRPPPVTQNSFASTAAAPSISTDRMAASGRFSLLG